MVTPGPGVRPVERQITSAQACAVTLTPSAGICIAVYGFLIHKRARISSRPLLPIRRLRRLAFPTVFGLGVPPIRPERRVINSITTVRQQRLTVALAKSLIRWATPPAHRRKFVRFYDAVRLVARGLKQIEYPTAECQGAHPEQDYCDLCTTEHAGPWFSPANADSLDSSCPESKCSGRIRAGPNETSLFRHDHASARRASSRISTTSSSSVSLHDTASSPQ